MNTPTHIVAALAVLSRRGDGGRNWTVAAGAVLPDVSIFMFYGWARLARDMPEREIWSVAYWREPWQSLGAISNSLPIAGALLIAAFCIKSLLLRAFSLALIIHFALDFPLHADDAHRHFWPLTDWRYHSPVSYWDSDYGGGLGELAQAAVFLIAALILWRRFPGRVPRVAIGALGFVYAASAFYFLIVFGR